MAEVEEGHDEDAAAPWAKCAALAQGRGAGLGRASQVGELHTHTRSEAGHHDANDGLHERHGNAVL